MPFVSSLLTKFRRKKAIKCFQNGELQKAIFYFEKLIFQEENNEDFYYLALAKMGLRDFACAANYLEKILEAYKYNELVLTAYYETQQMLRHWDVVQDIIHSLKSINPNSKKYELYETFVKDVVLREKKVTAKEKLYEAETYIEKKEFETAYKLLKEAENLDASNSNIIYNLGYVLLKLKRKKAEFYPYFERATILDPNNKKYQQNFENIKRTY
jgi:tetratricopeptide (TPR) repeat protein